MNALLESPFFLNLMLIILGMVIVRIGLLIYKMKED
jgi:hypothetical protein